MATVKCQGCSQGIVGVPKSLNGKRYCRNCYEELLVQVEQQAQEKIELIEYVKFLFGINEFPLEWDYQLQSLLKEGKTIAGIQGTLYYFYEILNNNILFDYGLNIVKPKYEEAKKYFAEVDKLSSRNEKVELQDNIRTVKIKRPRGVVRKYDIDKL